jgi:hypothetical protein
VRVDHLPGRRADHARGRGRRPERDAVHRERLDLRRRGRGRHRAHDPRRLPDRRRRDERRALPLGDRPERRAGRDRHVRSARRAHPRARPLQRPRPHHGQPRHHVLLVDAVAGAAPPSADDQAGLCSIYPVAGDACAADGSGCPTGESLRHHRAGSAVRRRDRSDRRGCNYDRRSSARLLPVHRGRSVERLLLAVLRRRRRLPAHPSLRAGVGRLA